jgi:AraC-like DNA-binding protein
VIDRARSADCASESIRRATEAGVTVIETTVPAAARHVSRSDGCPRFTLILEGRVRPGDCANAPPVGPPTVVFGPAGASGPTPLDEERARWIEVRLGPTLARYTDPLDSPLWYVEGGPPAWVMARLYREFQAEDELASGIVSGLVLNLIAAMVRTRDGSERLGDGWLAAVATILRSRYAAPPSMKEIAGAVGVHPVSLARGFRRRFGVSPGSYARQLRVEQASRELAATRTPVRLIAAGAGFANTSHLTRTFKLESGMTPHAYRRLFRRPDWIDAAADGAPL